MYKRQLLHRKGGDAGDDLNYARTVTLTKGELTESVNVSGLVQSARVSSVTTSLTSKVVAVNVKVGDVVKKGDLICTLDDTDIRRAIQDKEKELSGEKQQLKDAVTKACLLYTSQPPALGKAAESQHHPRPKTERRLFAERFAGHGKICFRRVQHRRVRV